LIFNADEVQLGAEQVKRLQYWDSLLTKSEENPVHDSKFEDAENMGLDEE
jgi:hypothetical protein